MSEEEAPSRKEKKAQRDADRKKKGKKRKHDEVEKDEKADEQSEFERDFLPLDSGPVVVKDTDGKKKSKKDASRKRKSEKLEESAKSNETKPDSKSTQPKSKKRKKDKTDATSGVTAGEDAASGDKSHRFILFVGNLPYGATDTTIRAHFKKLEPFTLRHRTDPKTGKSKGFAFLEFEKYDRMKTCMKLYHHSMFDPNKTEATVDEAGAGDDEGPAKQKSAKASKAARRINVELTAGGGGKAEGRKEKIRVKNERLGEQRQRRAEAERKEREKKAKEEGEVNDVKPVKPVKKTTKKAEEATAVREDMGGMHPSRLARIAA